MLGGGFTSNRWKHQTKEGQTVVCRVIARVAGGYDVEFGPKRLRGFLPSESALAEGMEILLKFVGYRNHVPTFCPVFGADRGF